MFRAARSGLSFLVVIGALTVLWEVVKLLGGDPSEAWTPPFQWTVASDLNMPHVWDIAASFVEPAQRNGPPLGVVLVKAGIFTFQEAFGGFVFGALLGLTLAIVFVHSPLLERALVPYVVASQTVPIIAIAPVVVIWLRGGWLAVAVISAYLTFFPVAIAGLRGLRSPDPRALELMRSYAVGELTVFRLVRVPTALPFLFTALRVASVLAMIGAIVSEYYGGALDTLGANIEQDASLFQFEKAWSEIVIACILGIGFYLAVVLVERVATRWQPRVEMVGA